MPQRNDPRIKVFRIPSELCLLSSKTNTKFHMNLRFVFFFRFHHFQDDFHCKCSFSLHVTKQHNTDCFIIVTRLPHFSCFFWLILCIKIHWVTIGLVVYLNSITEYECNKRRGIGGFVKVIKLLFFLGRGFLLLKTVAPIAAASQALIWLQFPNTITNWSLVSGVGSRPRQKAKFVFPQYAHLQTTDWQWVYIRSYKKIE